MPLLVGQRLGRADERDPERHVVATCEGERRDPAARAVGEDADSIGTDLWTCPEEVERGAEVLDALGAGRERVVPGRGAGPTGVEDERGDAVAGQHRAPGSPGTARLPEAPAGDDDGGRVGGRRVRQDESARERVGPCHERDLSERVRRQVVVENPLEEDGRRLPVVGGDSPPKRPLVEIDEQAHLAEEPAREDPIERALGSKREVVPEALVAVVRHRQDRFEAVAVDGELEVEEARGGSVVDRGPGPAPRQAVGWLGGCG